MLLGEHLGRGDECTLMAGCDDLQEGHERDDGLPRADISLEEALHGDLALEVGTDLRDSIHLRVGELEGQGIAETVQERGAVGGCDRRGRACSTSAHREPHLKHERFREGQGTAGLLVVLVRLGLM